MSVTSVNPPSTAPSIATAPPPSRLSKLKESVGAIFASFRKLFSNTNDLPAKRVTLPTSSSRFLEFFKKLFPNSKPAEAAAPAKPKEFTDLDLISGAAQAPVAATRPLTPDPARGGAPDFRDLRFEVMPPEDGSDDEEDSNEAYCIPARSPSPPPYTSEDEQLEDQLEMATRGVLPSTLSDKELEAALEAEFPEL